MVESTVGKLGIAAVVLLLIIFGGFGAWLTYLVIGLVMWFFVKFVLGGK